MSALSVCVSLGMYVRVWVCMTLWRLVGLVYFCHPPIPYPPRRKDGMGSWPGG